MDTNALGTQLHVLVVGDAFRTVLMRTGLAVDEGFLANLFSAKLAVLEQMGLPTASTVYFHSFLLSD